MDERHVPMSDGYDQRMAEFAAEAHPSPDQCIRVLLDLLESVKRDLSIRIPSRIVKNMSSKTLGAPSVTLSQP